MAGAVAVAQKSSDFKERLTGYEEVPAVSTSGQAKFRASIRANDSELRYRLSYTGLEAKPQQAHIHLGQRDVNGGVSVFLCTNLGNGPTGTQACPDAPATVQGTLKAADVVGPAAQGIGPGEFAELVRAAASASNRPRDLLVRAPTRSSTTTGTPTSRTGWSCRADAAKRSAGSASSARRATSWP